MLDNTQMFYESWSTFCRICVDKIKSMKGLYPKLKANSYLFLTKAWRKPSFVMLDLCRRKQRKVGPKCIWKCTKVENTQWGYLDMMVEVKHCIVSTSSLILTTVRFPGRSLFVSTARACFYSRKHDSYSESCPREVMSPEIKPVWWDDAWQTSPNFADLFLFFLEAVYVLSQPVKPRACLSVCVPLVYAFCKQGSAFPQRHFAVKIIL